MREVALLLLMRIQYCRPNLPIPFPLPKPFSFNVSISAVTKESVALKIAFGGHTIQLHLGQRHEQDRAMCPAPFQYISKSGFSFSLRHNNVHKLYTTRKTVRPGSAVANLRASTKRPNPKMGLQRRPNAPRPGPEAKSRTKGCPHHHRQACCSARPQLGMCKITGLEDQALHISQCVKTDASSGSGWRFMYDV